MMLPYKLKPTWIKSMHSLLFLILLFYYLCHKVFFILATVVSERLKISQFAFEGFYTSFESVKISPTPHPRIFIVRGSPQNGRYFFTFFNSGERRHAQSEWVREKNDASLEGYVRSCLGAKLLANTFSHLGLKDIASPCECLFIWMLGRCYFGQLHE